MHRNGKLECSCLSQGWKIGKHLLLWEEGSGQLKSLVLDYRLFHTDVT